MHFYFVNQAIVAAFKLIYLLIIYILLVNKIIYKWPHFSFTYYYNLNSQNHEALVCLVIYETKEIPNLYLFNQTRFDFKSINGM